MEVIRVPEILLPADGVDLTKWAVNACDQYTSDYGYWRQVERLTSGALSAYNLIFPEIYLNDKPEQRIARINENMRRYLSGGVFKKTEGGFILVERTTQSGTRKGLLIAVDLEKYSFINGEKSLIRSTEATIAERIPPRVKIRENAEIELPHVMLLYDDETNSVLNAVRSGKVLYDAQLNFNGGRVKGTFVTNPQEVINAFYALSDGVRMQKKYSSSDKLLFAVGDGNHSLAAAKTCWDALKIKLTESERKDHPARFALVEAVNVHDAALTFKPIHRLLKTDKPQLFCSRFKTSGGATAYIVTEGKKRKIPFNADIPAGIRETDDIIKNFIAENGGSVDYVHGGEELCSLTAEGNVLILLPSVSKNDFFRLIMTGGNLPRKTFSMGEGDEKRFYLEAKLIR